MYRCPAMVKSTLNQVGFDVGYRECREALAITCNSVTVNEDLRAKNRQFGNENRPLRNKNTYKHWNIRQRSTYTNLISDDG